MKLAALICLLLSICPLASAEEFSLTIFYDRSPSEGVLGYRAHTSPTRGGPYFPAADAGNNTFVGLTVTGLTYVVITAYNSDAESGYSNEVEFNPKDSTPGVASALWADVVGPLLVTNAIPAPAPGAPVECVPFNIHSRRELTGEVTSAVIYVALGTKAKFFMDGSTGQITTTMPTPSALVQTAPLPKIQGVKSASIAPPSPIKKAPAKITTTGSKRGKL